MHSRSTPAPSKPKAAPGRIGIRRAQQDPAWVRWTLTEGQLRISCTNTDQEEAFEELEISYKGEPLDIGFNVTYLLDVLANLTSNQVTCSFGDANSSVLITIAEDSNFRYVVMPMRI